MKQEERSEATRSPRPRNLPARPHSPLSLAHQQAEAREESDLETSSGSTAG